MLLKPDEIIESGADVLYEMGVTDQDVRDIRGQGCVCIRSICVAVLVAPHAATSLPLGACTSARRI
jgi:hypothetical protein